MKGRIDQAALRALHAARFAELPFDCGSTSGGISDTEEWRDWSTQPSTPDQLRIEAYLDAFDLSGKAILHVGSGNSRLAARFAGRARRIVGITVVPGEVRCAEALGLANYSALLHNKYDRGGLEGETFDFIVDNNPSTFCCCLSHLASMLEFYASSLAECGQAVTDAVGLGWTTEHSHPRWSFDCEDLAAVAGLAGLDCYRPAGETIVLAHRVPARPTVRSRGRQLARRLRRALEQLRSARRASATDATALAPA
jgi:hypothetical protein